MAIDQSDILAAWAEQNISEQGKLIDLMIAATLLRYDQNFVAIRVDELKRVASSYEVTRDVGVDGIWRVTVKPKSQPEQLELTVD